MNNDIIDKLSDDLDNKLKLNITENERNLYKLQKYKAKFSSPEEEYIYANQNFKICSKCKLNKNLNEFNFNTSGIGAFNKDGYRIRRPECKLCNKLYIDGKNKAKNIAKINNIPFKAPKDTKCALCESFGINGNQLVFDHCHKTNCFRGYLHNSCNRSIGVLGDNLHGIIKAFNYLNKIERIKIIQDPFTLQLKSIKRSYSF